MNEYNQDGISIDLRVVLARIWRFTPWLLLAAFVCGAAAWCISKFAVTPMYNSSATVYVYSDGTNNINDTMKVSYSELYAAQYLSDPYVAVLQSDSLLQKVSDRLELGKSPAALRRGLTITGGDRSLILTITYTDPDPEVAREVVQSITSVAPNEIKRVIKAGGISIVDNATMPTAPSSPNVSLNTLIGAAAGAAVLLIILVLREFLNSTIRSEEDITGSLSVPVLGVIPQIDYTAKDEKL
ncbi:MAG: hypothetical protein IJT18_02235 [Oscillospiraceae bacterium]|nr:hypothetical protein [Oscillospiraceae bacterium]